MADQFAQLPDPTGCGSNFRVHIGIADSWVIVTAGWVFLKKFPP